MSTTITIINLTPHAITISGQGYTDADWERFAGRVVGARIEPDLPVVHARSLPGRIAYGLAPDTTLADVELALCGRMGTGEWEFGEVMGDCFARRAGSITIAPTGKIARARERVCRASAITVADTGHTVPVTTVSYDGTIDLPDPAPDTVYVVSVITAQAAYLHGRAYDDLLVPGEQERDLAGRVIGCRSLQRWRPQLGSRRQYLDTLCLQAASAAQVGSGYYPDIQHLVPSVTLQRAVHAFEMFLAGLADPVFFRGDLEQSIPLLSGIAAVAGGRAP